MKVWKTFAHIGQFGTASCSKVSFIFDFGSLLEACGFSDSTTSSAFLLLLFWLRENFFVGLYSKSTHSTFLLACSPPLLVATHLLTCRSRSLDSSMTLRSCEHAGHAIVSFLLLDGKYFDVVFALLLLLLLPTDWDCLDGGADCDEDERKLEIWANFSFFSLILRKFSYNKINEDILKLFHCRWFSVFHMRILIYRDRNDTIWYDKLTISQKILRFE